MVPRFYSSIPQDGVNCAELMPKHCDIFFKQSNTTYPHSVTVLGYGEDEELNGTSYWRIKNSWGPEWGEGGYIRMAAGLGHCYIGTIYSIPVCQIL